MTNIAASSSSISKMTSAAGGETRQSKRQMLAQAREHMEVVGSDGETSARSTASPATV